MTLTAGREHGGREHNGIVRDYEGGETPPRTIIQLEIATQVRVTPRGAFYDYLEAPVTAGLGKRLMFGSDQMRWPADPG